MSPWVFWCALSVSLSFIIIIHSFIDLFFPIDVHMVQRMLVENSTPNSHLDSLHSHALDINDITPLYPHHSPQLGSRTSGISLQKAVKIFSPANQESAPLIGNAACDVDDETKPFDLEPERETVL